MKQILTHGGSEVMKLFAEHLTDKFTPNNDVPDDEIERQLRNFTTNIPGIKSFPPRELQSKSNF